MTQTSHKQMHLNLNLRGVGFHRSGWRHPLSRVEETITVEFHQELARLAEKAKFDAVFLADSPVMSEAGNSTQPLDKPFEPFVLLSAIAAATENIGLIGTVSTTYYDPFVVATRTASLDLLSGGRLGVNFVTTQGDRVAKNFGFDTHPDYSDRYTRAEEFLRLVLALWNNREPDNSRTVKHRGRYFALDRGLDIARSAQGRPLVVQAGASENGRGLAASYAEAVYTGSSTLANGQAFYRDVKSRAAANGRNPETIRILPGIVPFVGGTEAEALRLERELEDLSSQDIDTIAWLSSELETDLTNHDPSGPLPFDILPTEHTYRKGVSRLLRLVAWAREDDLSIEDLARKAFARLRNVHWTLAGTGEQIADQLQAWFQGGAADGFNILTPVNPIGLEGFVSEVVPILQRRGLFKSEYSGSTLRSNFGLEGGTK